MPKTLQMEHFLKTYLKVCFSFCKGEQRLKFFIYQNSNVPLILLPKKVVGFKLSFRKISPDKKQPCVYETNIWLSA